MKKFIALLLLAIPAALNAQTKFGVLVHGRMNVNKKIDIAKDLGVSYVRDAIVMQVWSGRDEDYEKYINAGLKVILNVNWGQVQSTKGEKTPVPFPKDTAKYKKILSDILDKYQPEVVVIENEELNRRYHSGPIEDYINELTAAINVVHSKGLKVTNAGLTGRGLCLLVYNDYIKRGMQKEANDFARRCMKPAWFKEKRNNIKDDEDNEEGETSKLDKLIEAYKKLPLDYVNFHLYEPIKNIGGGTKDDVKQITPNAVKEITDYLSRATGKKVMSNECGERSSSPELVPQMLQEFAKYNMEYVVWFSGDGEAGGKALQ
ncbi:MAG TPA: hypothetical protein VH396_00505, partial [Chitinophagaceae bacterium]